MEAFNVAVFVGMDEVERGSANELMWFVAEEFTNRLCQENPAGILGKVNDANKRDAGGRRVHDGDDREGEKADSGGKIDGSKKGAK